MNNREGVRIAAAYQGGPIPVAATLPTEPAMPSSQPAVHRPFQIGTHDGEGFRTHTIPGDVCLDCSTPRMGHWVPISQCSQALAALDADQ